MKTPNLKESPLTKNLPDLPIYFLGDHHGKWSEVFAQIQRHSLDNCILFSVGDAGIGFQTQSAEIEHTQKLNNLFKEKNIQFLAIRGNHDDPSYFEGPKRIDLPYFELLPDYCLLTHNDLTLQAIGGATSIDRSVRVAGVSYWHDEGLYMQSHLIKKAHILVTHTAPLQCAPPTDDAMVRSWSQQDAYLLEDLRSERHLLQEILEKVQPKHHFYGHFHKSHRENINGCQHVLLNINELYPSPSNLKN